MALCHVQKVCLPNGVTCSNTPNAIWDFDFIVAKEFSELLYTVSQQLSRGLHHALLKPTLRTDVGKEILGGNLPKLDLHLWIEYLTHKSWALNRLSQAEFWEQVENLDFSDSVSYPTLQSHAHLTLSNYYQCLLDGKAGLKRIKKHKLTIMQFQSSCKSSVNLQRDIWRVEEAEQGKLTLN